MNHDPIDDDDAHLVAFVHGELDAAAEQAVRGRLAADPDLRARHAALVAADRALLEALEAPRAARPGLLAFWRPLLAAAAVVVVGLVLAVPRADASAARNEFVELRIAPRGGAQQPLSTDVELELAWHNRGDGSRWRVLEILPFHFGDTIADLGSRWAADRPEAVGKYVPLVVSAELLAPDGKRLPARLAAPHLPIDRSATVVQRVHLHDFEIETDAPPPYLGGRPGDHEWVDDFGWAHENMPNDGPRRWLLDQIGEWTLELRVECVPPPTPGKWPTFAEPLVVATKVIATGIASAWGDEHDGMQARLLLATGCKDIDRAPLVIQLRNGTEHTRVYNVVGTTMAKIPQPLHFDLFVDDDGALERWQQHDQVGVILTSDDLWVRHPPGTIRTLVVRPEFWRRGPTRLGDLPGAHTLVVEFQFEPTLWTGDAAELWRGTLRTGALPVQVPPR